MKRMFLTSSLDEVIADISKKIGTAEKLLFITTASEGKSVIGAWLARHRAAVVGAGFEVTDFTFTNKSIEEIKTAVAETDIICMEGGDTCYLLEQIQKTNCASIFIEAINGGKVYLGSSAGSMIATPDICLTTDPEHVALSKLTDFTGLHLVDFQIFVHVNREKYAARLISFAQNFSSMHGEKVISLQDNQYIYVEDDMYKIVTV